MLPFIIGAAVGGVLAVCIFVIVKRTKKAKSVKRRFADIKTNTHESEVTIGCTFDE